MINSTDKETSKALNRVYVEESSMLDEELAQMQWMSLPKEDWRYVVVAEYTDVLRRKFESKLTTINQYDQELPYGQVKDERD